MTDKAEYTIDAAGRTFGRVASEAAKALMGKTRAAYTPHIRSDIHVVITNASKMHISERKGKSVVYKTYSGYHSGQTVETLSSMKDRRGIANALRLSVGRMLPRNTMKVARLKNLEIKQ